MLWGREISVNSLSVPGYQKNLVIPANAGIQESIAQKLILNDNYMYLFLQAGKERVVESSKLSGRLDSGLRRNDDEVVSYWRE